MRNNFIITSIILSCSLLTACGGGGGNSSKTHSTTTSETTSVVSITTSGPPGSSGNNTDETTESSGSAENNSTNNTGGTTVTTEANETTEVKVQNEPVISNPTNVTRISEAKYNTGTILTRTVNDTDSALLHKNGVTSNTGAYTLSMKDGEVVVDIIPLHTGDPADYRELVSRNLNILRGRNGEAVGFYGIVETYTSETARDLSGKEKYGRMDYIVAMNEEEKKRPSVTANYTGKLYYDQEQAPGQEADINLRYEDRQVTGTIIDRDRPHFSLTIDISEPHDVDEDGSFMTALVGTNDRTDKNMHGYIDGGFYGKDGEIVAGSVHSRDDNRWGGVFGGEKQE
ncbi:transferrin-binding protein-like solute binding protein [Salmonella enterica]|nr:transferrin-binding protein-like solute binding protein [Salmonella enterica]ELJ4826347.1 transferrin-binding protein-like solute binding protein [Salmonella enterica]